MTRSTVLTSSAWVTVRYATVSVAGFVASLAFARFTSKETFGQYQLILSTVALFSLFSLPGLNMAAIKAMTEHKPTAVTEAVRRSFWWSLAAVPILLGYGAYQLAHQQLLYGGAFVVAAIIFPFFYAPNTWYAYYEGRSDFRSVAVRSVLQAVTVTVALILALKFGANLFYLVSLFLGLSAAFNLYYYAEVRRQIGRQDSSVGGGLDFGYGLRVSVQKAAYTVSEAMPPLVVGYLLGHAAVAVFQVANLFLGAVAGFIGALSMVTLPAIFQRTDGARQAAVKQAIITGVGGSIGFALVVLLLFQTFYGPTYDQSYHLALSLVGLPLVMAMRTYAVNVLTAAERNGLIVIIYALANLVSLMVFWFVERSTGLVTAAAVYLYVLNLTTTLPLLIACRRLPEPATNC